MKIKLFAGCLLSGILLVGMSGAHPSFPPDYDTARPLFWSKLYPQGGETLYCGTKFSGRRGRKFNVEHVFPMSWVIRELKCGTRTQCRKSSQTFNKIEADMHNLFPSLKYINDARGSFRYGMIPGEKRQFGKKCDFEVNFRRRVVEPRKAVRGDIARAMFYMKDTYGMVIFRKQGNLLLNWHEADPPSRFEKRRNDKIEKIQGNRNKFIDKPELARDLRF